MWFGAWLGTAYTGQWWGDGSVVPPPTPTPGDGFPLGLRNVAWRPLTRPESEKRSPPADITPVQPADIPELEPALATVERVARTAVATGITRPQREMLLRTELEAIGVPAKPDYFRELQRRTIAAVDRVASQVDQDDPDDIEALIVLMHIL